MNVKKFISKMVLFMIILATLAFFTISFFGWPPILDKDTAVAGLNVCFVLAMLSLAFKKKIMELANW